MQKGFPDGAFDFRALVTGGCHSVDKTLMVKEVCEALGKVLLYTRSRRFGKSFNLSCWTASSNLKKAKTHPE